MRLYAVVLLLVLALPSTARASYELITTTGTWTVPPGVYSLNVFAVGGGGGGGGNAAGWGSGGGGGCGGAINGTSINVSPGQQIAVTVGAGGLGGQGAGNGSSGGTTSFGSYLSAAGGSWGRSGYYNLYGSYYGGSGGGSSGGGGGNGWSGFYAIPGDGGTAGGATNSHGAGGDCIGGGWSVNPASFITQAAWSAGVGGDVPQSYNYYGGGGGGGVVIAGSAVQGGSEGGTPGGSGYGGGGGGHCWTCGVSGNGGSGASGVVYVEYIDPPPSCTISLAPSSVNEPGSATLSWNSTSGQSFYISNVGYVSASGSTTIAPSLTTTYNGTVEGLGGTATCENTLTVNALCTLDGEEVSHGSSITAYESETVPYGEGCASEVRTCTNGTLSGAFAYTSCVVDEPASCTLDGVTVAHGDSRTFYSVSDAVAGQLCSDHALSRTCNNGVLSGSSAYEYATCGCTPFYSCSGQTIQYTNDLCSTSPVTTCVTPFFCSSGAAVCLNAPPSFNAQGSFSGHLQIRPQILPVGGRARVHWDLSNVESCTVEGSNGDSWTGEASGASGRQTSPIVQHTRYTLLCEGSDGSSVSESQVVNILPVFLER